MQSFTVKSILLLLFPIFSLAQVGVNTTTPQGAIDVTSTNNGILVPRVALSSTADVTTVVNPQGGALAISTLVYNTTASGTAPDTVVPGFYYWDGTRWVPISGTRDWSLNGNSAITTPATPATYGTSTIGNTENFIGTTDAQDVTFATDNIERMRIANGSGNVGIGTASPTYKFQVTDPTILATASYAENTYAGNFDGTGIRGVSVNAPGYGIGGSFSGGYRGALVTNPATNYNGTTVGLLATSTGTTGVGTRVGGQFSASGGLNNYGIIVPPAGGQVGIGTSNPTNKLHVADNVAGNTTLRSENTYVGNTDGIGVLGRSENNPGYGIGGRFNGGYAGIEAGSGNNYSGTTYGVLATASGNAGTRYAVYGVASGVGTGTRVGGYFNAYGGTTNRAIEAVGTVRINDGTQGAGKVFTSDAAGNGSWQSSAIDNVVGVLGGAGASIPYNLANYVQTGSYIVLPPGKFAVNVTMLLSKASLTYSPNNSFFWVRSTFSNSGGLNPLPSPDIIGSNLCSGNYPGSSIYALLTGTIIIHNTTAANRIYYYVAGSVVTNNTTQTITNFGGTYWAENNIIAYRLN
ncbi:YXWGXW repeat-containing protein [Flavobacterium caeni]|uniref:Uncharacterized protein n=1 Tax=Flavobacterium caeni TaxID=490189 RepID=A0A1G5KAJ1_9FLAO|nr:YXWGXW repeat-containing protein [Flavobacterium caeni]SCY97030.1 hypothetical protein SAMN02927903_03175 [Flavobacterium caeni]